MEKNSGVLANTLYRILRYKGSTIYRALTVFEQSPKQETFSEPSSFYDAIFYLKIHIE
jgi:hypothetical protein